MRKNIICLLLSAIFVIGFLNYIGADGATVFADAQSEIAMELTTEKVLSENNADVKLPMASTTKILTAIIIIEDCDLEETIIVPEKAVGVEGSSVYLKKGEEIDVRDLLYGLLLRSGNDCAAALAIHHSGSIEKFAEVMNYRAKKIGAINSNFKNPSGLPDDEHYTTARDLCIIACYARRNEIFSEIVSAKNYTGKYKSYVNKNKMLRLYEGANGIKTGYTVKAGRCLVSSAERDGMEVVCVVLNCPDMYERSCLILDNCFNNYKLMKISSDKIFMCNRVPCKLSNDSYIVVNTNKKIDFKVIPLKNDVDNSIAELKIYNENDLIFSEKLYSI